MPTRGRDNWISFASGPFGYWAVSVASDGRLRLEAYLDTGDKALNKRLFDEFASSANEWESAVGIELVWERLDDKRASRIAAYHPLILDDEVAREAARGWAVSALLKMFKALNDQLRSRAKALRDRDSAASDAAEARAHDAGMSVPPLQQPRVAAPPVLTTDDSVPPSV